MLKQARALLHVRQTVLINFRYLLQPSNITPGLDLLLSASINSVLILPVLLVNGEGQSRCYSAHHH